MTKVACCCLLAVALFACSKKSDEGGSAGGGGECGEAVNKGMDAVDANRKQQLADRIAAADTPEKKERLEKGAERAGKMAESLRPILTKHCNEDKWSAESIACIGKVTKREEIQQCVQALPKDQADKVTQDVMQAMMGGMRMRPPGAGGQPSMMPHGGMQQFDHPPMGSAVPTGSGAPPAGSAAPAPAGSAAPAPAGSAATAPAGSATPATPTKTDAPKK